MQSALICGGVALLVLACLGTQLRNLHQRCSPVRQLLYLDHFLRLTLRQLRELPLPHADAPLPTIRQEIRHLQQHIQRIAALPGGSGCLPRILSLTRMLAQEASPSPEAMQEALRGSGIAWTSEEIASVPLALTIAQAKLLHNTLCAYRAGSLDADDLNECLWQHAEHFCTLRQMNWLEQGEQADPLHSLLLDDPSGTYSRMTAANRLSLRSDAERFAHHLRLPAADVIRKAMTLCHAAGPQALEAYAGYWLQDAHGMAQLYRSLGRRAGWLYAHLAPQKNLCRYILRCLMGGIAGFAFLQVGHPVFMLPFYSICASSVMRCILRLLPEKNLPAIAPESITPAFRTLVVLPAHLADPINAARQVERLRRVSRLCGEVDADFLLLGDPPSHITAISSQDGIIAAGAMEALAILNDSRCMYLQRGRFWNDAAHIYSCRGGVCGALQEICRLIVRGESVDAISCSSVDLSHFERRYAYLLVLSEHIIPGADMLERLLGAAAHPMNIRYPTRGGWRGYAVLSPENCAAEAGCWLLRPDAFLEATEDYISVSADEMLLCSELAGHAPVRYAFAASLSTNKSWERMLRRVSDAWRLLPWQLPWVRTPAGIVRNPLDFYARFSLRDRLRETALSTAQIVLLLWALLTQSWPLLMLAFLSPKHSHTANAQEWFMELLSLPTQAAVSTAGMLAPWISCLAKLPTNEVLELWAQWIAASVFVGLAIALSGMRIPALLLAVGFAALPLLRQRQH